VAGVSGSGFTDSALDDPATVQLLERMAGNTATPIGDVMIGEVVGRDDLIAQFEHNRTMAVGFNYPTPTSAPTDPFGRLAPFGGVVPQLRRRLRLLDLMPSMTIENKVLPYVRESGSLDTAAETGELAVSPQADQALTDAEARAVAIVHWLKLPRDVLDDVSGLATAVNSRLIYGVQRRFEAQILGGDGVGENIEGILNVSGIGSVTYDATKLESDQTLAGITTVTLSDAVPNGVVANPLDVQSMLVQKASGSGERLDGDGAFATPPTSMWGLPLIESKVIPQGQALVGDFASGCTALVRSGVALRISDSDQDDFIKRRLTCLAEARLGLAVWQPSAFTVVHFS
jgi:HK97 family phage major capsid protein